MSKDPFKIALAGNPNSGKTSLFNSLTGLNQRVGNYPGVTIDKKTGNFHAGQQSVQVLDLPGTYSLYPKSQDEYIAYQVLLNPSDNDYPDLIVVVADAANLKRNLLFCTQIMDLGKPVILALSMMDVARKKGMDMDLPGLSRELGIPVVAVNPRKGKGIGELKKQIVLSMNTPFIPQRPFVSLSREYDILHDAFHAPFSELTPYAQFHLAASLEKAALLGEEEKNHTRQYLQRHPLHVARLQAEEVTARYDRINNIIKKTVVTAHPLAQQLFTERIDKILLHRVWGYVILLSVLFLMFQAVFWLASYPMDWIDGAVSSLSAWVGSQLPETWWADLLVNGIIAGIGGIVIFVPQIAILFFIITILEDTGYMARISFLMDRLMRGAGLNGRSVMPLISGMACAIPAIMSARTIENYKERLITILVTPLMSCSARLPVYVILISLVIPEKYYFGFLGLQGLIFLALYLLGFVTAILMARIFSYFIKTRDRSMFLMELPVYHLPRWRNAFITMYEKAKVFVTDAGKIIIVISLVLWALASYGPGNHIKYTAAKYKQLATQQGALTEEQRAALASEKLEHSYAGHIGKFIEPVIRPLGYDWKIGIALLSSFAAREVFVGTMSTLYSVGSEEDETRLKDKMRMARRTDGTPVYTLATGLSLLMFYAFAMQCMSTLAIVKKETRSWKWVFVQLAYLTGIAYLAAFVVYQMFK